MCRGTYSPTVGSRCDQSSLGKVLLKLSMPTSGSDRGGGRGVVGRGM